MITTIENFKPVENRDKIERLISLLQDRITSGQFKAGMKLPPERELADQLGVSRFSLREALRVARSQGLIEVQQGRCSRIATPNTQAASDLIGLTLKRTPKTFLDLIEVRKVLECQIASFAAERASLPQINKLRKTIEELENNTSKLEICIEKDIEFHELLLEATGNIVFKIILNPLSELLKKSRHETMKKHGIASAINGHKAVLEAIINRDSVSASAAMKQHLEKAEEDLI